MAKAEGMKIAFDGIEAIRTDLLEVFEIKDLVKVLPPHGLRPSFEWEFTGNAQYIKTVTKEFSAVCPFSGLPDLAILIIEYYPDSNLCIELKSLKYYTTSFRSVGLYQEGVTVRIYDDLKAVLKTDRLKVTTLYNARGGFVTTCRKGQL